MTPISISVKCYKKRAEGCLALYFDTVTILRSGLSLNDVSTIILENYRDLLSSSPCTFVLDICVKYDKDYIKCHTIIPSCI